MDIYHRVATDNLAQYICHSRKDGEWVWYTFFVNAQGTTVLCLDITKAQYDVLAANAVPYNPF